LILNAIIFSTNSAVNIAVKAILRLLKKF